MTEGPEQARVASALTVTNLQPLGLMVLNSPLTKVQTNNEKHRKAEPRDKNLPRILAGASSARYMLSDVNEKPKNKTNTSLAPS